MKKNLGHGRSSCQPPSTPMGPPRYKAAPFPMSPPASILDKQTSELETQPEDLLDDSQTAYSTEAVFKPVYKAPTSWESFMEAQANTVLGPSALEDCEDGVVLGATFEFNPPVGAAKTQPVTEIIEWPAPPAGSSSDVALSYSGGRQKAVKARPVAFPDLVKTVKTEGLPGQLSRNERYILTRMRIFRDRELESLNESSLRMRNQIRELQCRVQLLEAVIVGAGEEVPDYENSMIVM
ncbi:hypothetical protein FISHEDRAFT_55369 [Fistulina hepatica ATCC 64428]|uniref:Uncharacterized protein n=1 Tax=Fistulina hepatica ATCC 64428 TaxID=1128425 RepID=A0A0D7AN64_9AGAR|nr:hypothetical protein FISHEDRAFT_55369 [Fistulina hepatica ATCC 64428]